MLPRCPELTGSSVIGVTASPRRIGRIGVGGCGSAAGAGNAPTDSSIEGESSNAREADPSSCVVGKTIGADFGTDPVIEIEEGDTLRTEPLTVGT